MTRTTWLNFGCTTCQASGRVPLDDPHELAAEARAFFVAHARCMTTIGVVLRHYDGWRVTPEDAPSE